MFSIHSGTTKFLLNAFLLVVLVATHCCAEAGRIVWPCSGTVTSKYGRRTSPCSGCSTFHHGIDIGVGSGTVLGSPGNGTVSAYFYDSCAGNLYKIGYGSGWETRFLHCSASIKPVGSSVTRNVDVAKSGNTGSCTTGAHLHFEVRKDGVSQSIPGSAGAWVTRGTEIPQDYNGLNNVTAPTYTTADYLWFGNVPAGSGTNEQFNERGTVDMAGNYTPISGDFNGDGNYDIFWYGPGSDPDRLRFGRSTESSAAENAWFDAPGTVDVGGTYKPVAGDFNGDGRHDILWYGVGTNPDNLWLGRATDKGGTNGWFDSGGAVEYNGNYTPLAGDFNGDGRDDLLLYGPGADADAVRWGRATHSGAATNGWFEINGTVAVGGTYRPVTGDFNGDGHDDVFWYNPGTDQDYIWYGRATTTGGDNGWWDSYTTEFAGDYKPIAGDFNADGKCDVFLYQAGTANDYIRAGSATKGSWSTSLGSVNVNGTYKPTSGDYDNDGTWDIFWHGPGA